MVGKRQDQISRSSYNIEWKERWGILLQEKCEPTDEVLGNLLVGLGETAQRLRARVPAGSLLGTHTRAHSHLELQLRGIQNLFLISKGIRLTCSMYVYSSESSD